MSIKKTLLYKRGAGGLFGFVVCLGAGVGREVIIFVLMILGFFSLGKGIRKGRILERQGDMINT